MGFFCSTIQGSLSKETCIKRQQSDSYAICQECSTGQKIRALHPKINILPRERDTKRGKGHKKGCSPYTSHYQAVPNRVSMSRTEELILEGLETTGEDRWIAKCL